MKTITLYECNYCHTRFDSVDACSACEQHHKKPEEMAEVTYLSIDKDVDGYPDVIAVRMVNGKVMRYKKTISR